MLKKRKIKLVCFDVDGVLTDGMVHIDQDGREYKSFRLTEMDALNDIKNMGFKIAAITGEDTPIVEHFKKRFPWDAFVSGCKDKVSAIKMLEREFCTCGKEICYVGDGKYDVPAIRYAGLGACPQNAIKEAKAAADVILEGSGGQSCIYELFLLLKEIQEVGVDDE